MDDSLAAKTKTVAKAFELLDCLSEANGPLSVAELGRTVGLSRSTTYRLLRTLASYGYVIESVTDPDKLQIGPRVLKLATSFLDRHGIRTVARPYLLSLRDLSGETVHLVIPYQGQVLHIDKVETLQPVRLYSPIGAVEWMHCTAVGKSILAALPEAEVDAIVRRHGLHRRTESTITDPSFLKEHLSEARANGFAMSNNENEEGIRGIGVGVVPLSGPPIAAISISGPAYRFTAEQACRLVPDLKNAASRILSEMGLRSAQNRGADSCP